MFENMNYVYNVYKFGSFSKAAENLYITQPALSIAIRKLEHELAQPLFERGKSPLKLTDAGKMYIEKVEKIMVMEQECTDYFQELNELKTGKIIIGGAIISMTYLLPELIVEFSKLYPGVKIVAKEASLPILKNMLTDGIIDLILDTDWFEEDVFNSIPLFSNQILLAIPVRFKINKSKFLTPKNSKYYSKLFKAKLDFYNEFISIK